ncbi:MAG: ORF6N domain-containing protein [Daejeonella sp.]|uniref:ORF6N domain-containing protein n=1 Tax=Daejeonella sp. JGW-45 TaxID=3034148 RepID=UPI0023EBB7AB|nr:ORF6N domain-containing protein [Daejeonella sp. JGW-45]
MELVVPDEIVLSKIYYLRDHKVMLDSDLAELYGVETKALNQAVSRNSKRFPNDFMFQLDETEWISLRSQNVTSKRGGRKYLPYVFTEHGVLMLSSVLNSERAVSVNIQIMRIFTRMRNLLVNNAELLAEIAKIKNKLDHNDRNMEVVFGYLDELINKSKQGNVPRKRIGFKPDDI